MAIFGYKDSELMKKCKRIISSAEADQHDWLADVEDIAGYVSPWRYSPLNGSEESKSRKDYKIFNMAAVRMGDRYAAGMQGGLTNKAVPWFMLESGQYDRYDQPPDSKAWMDECTSICNSIIAHSNCYESLYTIYHDHGIFGTACSGALDDYEDVVRLLPWEAGRYLLVQDSARRVNILVIPYWEIGPTLFKSFGGENVSQGVKSASDNSDYKTKFKVYQVVMPNTDMTGDPRVGRWRYLSLRFEEGSDDKFLKVSGFNDFPALTPRLMKRSDMAYGYGLGHKILGDVRQLQKGQKMLNLATDLTVDPPVIADGTIANRREGIDRLPGGTTWVNGMAGTATGYSGKSGVSPLFSTSPDLQAISLQVENTIVAIREGLFNDLFLMLANMQNRAQITAEEIARRHQERVMMLGPIMEPLEKELLDPLVTFVFHRAWDAGILPPPPSEMNGSDINIRYTSVLRQTMELAKAAPLNEYVSTIGTLAQIDQGVLHRFDADAAAKEYHRILGAPGSVERDDREVWELRQQDAQQAQAQAAAQNVEAAKTAAEAARLASQANTGNGNLLEALARSNGGARP